MSDGVSPSVRTSSASIGIAVVVILTTVRCVLFVLALLIQLDGFNATWARDYSPIPLLPIDVSAGALSTPSQTSSRPTLMVLDPGRTRARYQGTPRSVRT